MKVKSMPESRRKNRKVLESLVHGFVSGSAVKDVFLEMSPEKHESQRECLVGALCVA